MQTVANGRSAVGAEGTGHQTAEEARGGRLALAGEVVGREREVQNLRGVAALADGADDELLFRLDDVAGGALDFDLL